jgi:hypothetical protein
MRHPEADHPWAAMRELIYSRVAPTKHRTDTAFQKLCSAKQGPNQMVMSFGAYIVTTYKGTNITDHNKHMSLWTGLRPEILAAIWKDEDYLTFDACLEAGSAAETALCLDAECNKAFKSAPRRQAAERAGKDKSKSKAHYHDLGEGCSSQGASQRSYGGFCSQGRGRGSDGHGQAGHQQHSSDGSGAQGAGTPRQPGACKSCSKFGYWAQDCKANLPEGSAASVSKQKPLGNEKAQ